jgi:hypothetical protein
MRARDRHPLQRSLKSGLYQGARAPRPFKPTGNTGPGKQTGTGEFLPRKGLRDLTCNGIEAVIRS